MREEGETLDLIVAGGGPGGSTAATLVAKQGHRVLLLERDRFPRYQIGESLLPSTVHGVCAMLGVKDEVERAGFQRKRGGTFRWGTNPEPWTFAFALSRKVAGPTSYAYQVERARFDSILLDNARSNGVDVRERHEVTSLIVENGRVRGVRFRDDTGAEREARSQYVVLATGNTDALHKHVGPRIQSEFFQNVALFGYYEDGKRLPAPNEGNILCAAFDRGWIWYIPLTPELTSVGAVVARDQAPVIQRGREEAMSHFIESCPLVADYLANGRRITEGRYGELRVRKDYSYSNGRFWRPGIALVGDAACFIDPVFSSGVHLATYSAVLAARSINTCLAGELREATCFEEFELRYRREFTVFYQFLLAMYDANRDESSYFWSAREILRSGDSDIEAFVELVGGISAPDDALFNTASRSTQQFSDALAGGSHGSALEDGDIVFREDGTDMLGSVMHEGNQLQMRAEGGEGLPEETLVSGGLVPSEDGFRWRRAGVEAHA